MEKWQKHADFSRPPVQFVRRLGSWLGLRSADRSSNRDSASLTGLRRPSRSVMLLPVALALLFPGRATAVDAAAPKPEDTKQERRIEERRSEQKRRIEITIHQRQSAIDSLVQLIESLPESLLQDQAVEEMERLHEVLQRDVERLHERLEKEARRHAEEMLLDMEPPEPPEPPEPFGHPRRKTVAGNMVRFGEDVHVRSGEVVQGDAILIGGSLSVDGEVDGDAIVLGGDLRVGRRAVIGGQALAVGGRVETSPGAAIEGQTVSFALFPRSFTWFPGAWPGRLALLFDLIKIGFLMLVAALLFAIVPERMTRAREVLSQSFLKCFGVGMLVLTGGFCAVGVTVMLLAVTIIGLPAALLLVFSTGVLLVASLLVGVLLIGERLKGAFRMRSGVPWTSVLLGLLLVLLPELLVDLLRVAGPMPGQHHLGLGLLSWALILSTVAAGLGALVVSRLGAPRAGEPAQAAA